MDGRGRHAPPFDDADSPYPPFDATMLEDVKGAFGPRQSRMGAEPVMTHREHSVIQETLTHRLITPADSNHHGSLYAGSLLRIALEAAYASACRAIGPGANVLLRRVHSVECYLPVPVGAVIELRGRPIQIRQAYLVIGLIGSPLQEHGKPWMDALFGFVQVDARGKPTSFPDELAMPDLDDHWLPLSERLEKSLNLS